MKDELSYRVFRYPSGALYEGTFLNLNRHGLGRWIHPNSESYEGSYINNVKEGLGVYTFGSIDRFFYGHWKNDAIDGEGHYQFGPGTFFCGEYKNDKKHGKGFYRYKDGYFTCQMWEHGNLIQEVKGSPRDHVEYQFLRGKLLTSVRKVAPKTFNCPRSETIQTGNILYPSGSTYSGEYSGPLKHGVGCLVYPTGESYFGEFKSNKYDGWGLYSTKQNDKKYVGYWEDGKMNGWGVYFFNPQQTEYYIGPYSDDKKHGTGLFHLSEPSKSFVQQWDKGVLLSDSVSSEQESEYIEAAQEIIKIMKSLLPMNDTFLSNNPFQVNGT